MGEEEYHRALNKYLHIDYLIANLKVIVEYAHFRHVFRAYFRRYEIKRWGGNARGGNARGGRGVSTGDGRDGFTHLECCS